MRTIVTIAIAALLFSAPDTQAADRAKSQGQIDAARTVLNEFKAKAGENKSVAADIAAAEQNLEKAAASLKAGEKMFGGLTDEAEADVRHQTALLDLNLKVAVSKLEKSRIEAESVVLGKKIDAVQAKVKIFDDFRAEIARLKSELAASEIGGKELDKLKREKGALEEQLAGVKKEKEALETVKAENLRLTGQLEKLQAEQKKLQAVPAAIPAPIKFESVAPLKQIEAPLPKSVPMAVEEKLQKGVPQKVEPVVSEPSVKIDELVAPLIVPALEK